MTTVLLAEDSVSQATVIQELLQSSGLQVRLASDGAEALKELRSDSTIDLLITDLMMPNVDGRELTRDTVKHFPHVPVIVITARGSESLAIDALADGAVGFVPKSLLNCRLLPLIHDLVQRVQIDQASADCGATLLVPELVFTLKSDLAAIAPVTESLQRVLAFTNTLDIVTRLRICSAVACALLNAICYGNLGMKDDEEGIIKLINGADAPASPHKIRLVISVGPQDVRFSIAHDGPGHLSRTNPLPGTPQSFELEDCRGLLLITSVMDQVHYDHPSREIIMVKEFA